MNNIIKRTWNQNRMVQIEDLTGSAFQSESGGHTFEISGIDDTGAAVSLSGTVEGRFIRPDGAQVTITGTASGGKASVTLTNTCYAVAGRFIFIVFVTSGGQKTAVYSCVGVVSVASGTAGGSVPPLVTDSLQTNTLDVTDDANVGGDLTAGGVLDVTQRRCYANLSQAGWYRVLAINTGSAQAAQANNAFTIDFHITTQYKTAQNTAHFIRLLAVYQNIYFDDETSRTVGSSTIIDGIRYTVDGSTAYVDIHYKGTSENQVSCDFDVNTSADAQSLFVPGGLVKVADGGVGTVLSSYSFRPTAPWFGASAYISWDPSYVSSASNMKVYSDGRRLYFNGSVKLVSGVNLQGSVIGTLNTAIQCESGAALMCAYTPNETAVANKLLDVYMMNGTSIRCTNNYNNSTTNLGAPTENNTVIICGSVPLA